MLSFLVMLEELVNPPPPTPKKEREKKKGGGGKQQQGLVCNFFLSLKFSVSVSYWKVLRLGFIWHIVIRNIAMEEVNFQYI